MFPEEAGIYWRYLAIAQYQAGDHEAAIESATKAMQLRAGGDAIDWTLLAMAHGQLGEREKALKWHRRGEDAIVAKKPALYHDLGVLAFNRLRAEADALLETVLNQGKSDSP